MKTEWRDAATSSAGKGFSKGTAMSYSIYRIDPIRDFPLAQEFHGNPIGHHSANLQRVLNVLRGGPLNGKYVLVCTIPHKNWQLATLSGERGKPVNLLPNTFFGDLKQAEWDIFRRRWEAHTGEILPIT
jgi:hypothetical protein